MENKQKEQAQKEMNPNKLEKANGGIIVPPPKGLNDDNKDSDNDNGGGSTGSW